MVESLFRGESPIGEVVTIGGVPFRIIGVTRKKGVYDGGNEDELVLIPVTTAMRGSAARRPAFQKPLASRGTNTRPML